MSLIVAIGLTIWGCVALASVYLVLRLLNIHDKDQP